MKINLLDIPAVYVNLPDQGRRRVSTEAQLIAWGHRNFSRVDGHYSRDGEWRLRGQSNSYIAAKSVHQTPFIVFEDDIMVYNNITEIEVPDDADAVYLGGCFSLVDGPYPYEAYPTDNPNVVRVRRMLSNHAIMYLSQELVDEYKNLLETDEAADLLMQKLSEKYTFYAIQPVIFFQNDESNPGKSTQSSYTRVVDYITREGFPAPGIY